MKKRIGCLRDYPGVRKVGHSRAGGNPDLAPTQAWSTLKYSWIPDRASLVRNDKEIVETEMLSIKKNRRIKIHCNSKMNERGFTLIEIIIVLSLLVLVLGLTSVYYANSLPKFRLNATTRDVMAEIRKAKALSRIQSEDQTIVFNLDKRKFGIIKGKQHEIPDGIQVKVYHPVTGEIKKGEVSITFRTSGGAEGYYVSISNKRRTQFIKIDPVVGAAMVQ